MGRSWVVVVALLGAPGLGCKGKAEAPNASMTGAGGAAAPAAGASGGSAAGGASAGSAATTMTVGAGSAGQSALGQGSAGQGPAPVAAGPPSYSRVWDEILLNKGCTGVLCHGGAQGMLLMTDKQTAYMNLVNVKAAGPLCGSSGMLRVKPGDPGASLLLDKLSHAKPACGESMPIGAKLAPDCVSTSPAVCNTEAEIALVRDWISSGAGM